MQPDMVFGCKMRGTLCFSREKRPRSRGLCGRERAADVRENQHFPLSVRAFFSFHNIMFTLHQTLTHQKCETTTKLPTDWSLTGIKASFQ